MQTRNSKRFLSWIIRIYSRFRSRCCSQSDVVCDSRSFRIFYILYWLEIAVRFFEKLDMTQKKCFMINVMNLQQSYERRKITKMKWIHEINNLIDFMIKIKTFSILKTLIDINTINMNINEWIKWLINKIDI
jgi:uncharacterized protein YsxB (DUF464 family)